MYACGYSNEVRGSRPPVRADVGTVVVTMGFASCFLGFSEHAFSSLWILAPLYERWDTVGLLEQLWRWWRCQGVIAIRAPCSRWSL